MEYKCNKFLAIEDKDSPEGRTPAAKSTRESRVKPSFYKLSSMGKNMEYTLPCQRDSPQLCVLHTQKDISH